MGDQNRLGIVARNPGFVASKQSFKDAAFIICFLESEQLNLLHAKISLVSAEQAGFSLNRSYSPKSCS